MQYPANITKGDQAFVVTFRDIPEAITQGYTYDEAIEMAEDALLTAMDFYFEDNRPVPSPSQPQKDEVLITLPVSASTKVMLLNLLLEEHVSQAELAKRMGIRPQQVTRIVNLEHTTKIDTVEQAFKALGRKLSITAM
ncbi:type II toxin-antitoxin system HicB family antitoxin [Psychrobacter aquimaris]|uniref:type II toxin-antitoxin system HicB family antitoxin n=1 Tax=Psychrobacter aquimaris TaxID=292733 RepID=UPI001868D183|nr:type II toxin-antitoxin system HicB family antitoxin [Psychrobacter aquimaris]